MNSPDNRTRYRQLCAVEPKIPLFSKDWWLDAVCGKDNWNVALSLQNDAIIGALPYYTEKKRGFTYMTMPTLTQHLGVWITYPPEQTATNKLSFEKDVLTELIEQLPKADLYCQNLYYTLTNWLPFYWKGFEQTTRYTYVLEDLSDPEKLLTSFKSNIRTDIKKAQKTVTVQESDDLEAFYKINSMTFKRQNISMGHSFELLQRIDRACAERSARKIFFAKDAEGRTHAAVYLVWDSESAYYLLSGGDPELRNSGATSLLLWHAIQYASKVTKRFDFEGSMIEPVERFFRAFGGTQSPYLQIFKTPSRILRFLKAVKSVLS